jgi:iron(III) transport system permease protein
VTAAAESDNNTVRPAWRGSWRGGSIVASLPSALMAVVLITLVVPPLVVLVLTSLSAGGTSTALTLSNFTTLLDDPRIYISTWNSLLFSALSTVLSIILGAILAWIVVRTNAPFQALAYLTAVVSLGTPYLIYVAAWLFLLGRAGPFNEFYQLITGSTDTLFNVYSMWGMVLIQGTLWTPLVFLLLAATFRRSNAEMEEAARLCGASVLETIWHVSFKLAWPGIAGMALFVFIRNIESFDVPVLIGGPGNVYLLTTDIYLSMSRIPPQMGHASAFSVVLVGIVSVLLYFYGRLTLNADKYASVTGKGFRPRLFDLGRWRWLGGAIVIGNFLFVLVLPLIAVLWISLMPFVRPIRVSAIKLLTLENYRVVLADPRYLELAFNTVTAAAAAATVAMALMVLAGWLIVRRWPGAKLVEQLANLPIVFPGIVLGVALLTISLRTPFPLYGTLAVIALAFVIRFMPYGMRYAHSGILQIHRELEEAAGASGASQWIILRRIVVPLLLPAIVSGWVFIFLLGANELSMAVLLSGPRTQVMAVAMFEQWSSGQSVEVFALGMVWTLFMAACTLVVYAFAGRALLGVEEGKAQ